MSMLLSKVRGFEEVAPQHKQHEQEVTIPMKATPNSAGYDFFCPIDLDILPQTKVSFATDIKAYMQPGEVLLLFPRSSTGIKHDLELANAIAVGDGDFYENPDNDGNYRIVLWNRRPAWEFCGSMTLGSPNGIQLDVPIIKSLQTENTVHIKAGDRLVQGIFFQTLPADQDGVMANERSGGIGSTGR